MRRVYAFKYRDQCGEMMFIKDGLKSAIVCGKKTFARIKNLKRFQLKLNEILATHCISNVLNTLY